MTPPVARVLIVDDEEGMRDVLSHLVKMAGFEPLVAPDGEAALALIRRESPDVMLVDVKMPGMDGLEVLARAKAIDGTLAVVIMTAYGFVQGAVEALRAGAHDYLEKPLNHAAVVGSLHRALTDRKLRQTIQVLTDRVRESDSLRDLMGPSDVVARLSAEVARVARSNFAVLVMGETGTGKELVARAIHQASSRAAGDFVAVDCAAIPEPLFESELFGHERGAFTGAERQSRGMFEVASGGTLFLDEIGNMPVGCQAKLLRALQTKSVVRVGSTRPVPVDIRLVAATNQDLEAPVGTAVFRRDLFFRINEFTISIPPLRERKGDILFLAKRFMDLTNHELSKTVRGFSEAAVERLLSYGWPGNVRELRSVVRRAVLLADATIEEAHLALPTTSAPPAGPAGRYGAPVDGVPAGRLPLRKMVQRAILEVERAALTEALRETGGNKARAARLLQIDYKTIHMKVKVYRIDTHGGEENGQAQDA